MSPVSNLLLILFLHASLPHSFAGFFRRSNSKTKDSPGHEIIVDGPGAVFTSAGESVNIVMSQSSGTHTFQSGEPGERLIAQESRLDGPPGGHQGPTGGGPVLFVSPPPSNGMVATSGVTLAVDGTLPPGQIATTHQPNSPAANGEVTQRRQSTSPVTDFIRRHTPRLFRRRPQPEPNIDPSKMTVPELIAAISSLPPSQFDKVADQLIAESFGMGSMAIPGTEPIAGSSSAGIGGGLMSSGFSSGLFGGLSGVPSLSSFSGSLPSIGSLGSSLLPSLPSLPSMSLPSFRLPSFTPRLPSLNLPSLLGGGSLSNQNQQQQPQQQFQYPLQQQHQQQQPQPSATQYHSNHQLLPPTPSQNYLNHQIMQSHQPSSPAPGHQYTTSPSANIPSLLSTTENKSNSLQQPLSSIPTVPLLMSASSSGPLSFASPSNNHKTVAFPVYVSSSTRLPGSDSLASSSIPNLLSTLPSFNLDNSQSPPWDITSLLTIEPSLETVHQIIAAAAASSNSPSPSGSQSSFGQSSVPSPVIHGAGHPLDTLNSIISGGFINDINTLRQPFSFDETKAGPRPGLGLGSTTSTTSTTTERPFRHRWFGQSSSHIPIFAPLGNRAPVGSESKVIPSQPQIPPPSPDGQQYQIPIAQTVAEAEKVITKYPLQKTYPILDTSSSDVKIFHAPHNPVDILKIFANAYDKTANPGGASILPEPLPLMSNTPIVLNDGQQKFESRSSNPILPNLLSTGATSTSSSSPLVPLNQNAIHEATTPTPLQVTILKRKK